MMPLAWVESAGLGTHDLDLYPHLRHTWRVAYRCPACSTVDTADLPQRVLSHDGDPAPVDPAGTSRALAALIGNHSCPTPASEETPC